MSDGDMAQLSLRLPGEQMRALERVARASDRTVSAEVRRLIRLHCKEHDTAAPAPIPGQLEIDAQEAAA